GTARGDPRWSATLEDERCMDSGLYRRSRHLSAPTPMGRRAEGYGSARRRSDPADRRANPGNPGAAMSLLAVQRIELDQPEAWERKHPTGSAWPTFTRAWHRACAMERYIPGRRDRQETWKLWLHGGPPLTKERERELLMAAGPGASRYLESIGVAK